MYGPGAALPKIRHQYSHKLPPETIAFVLEFIHHPDSEEYSSYESGHCDGKQKSWISELLIRRRKSTCFVVQLSKTSLPFMIDIHCNQECEQLEIRPISFSTFFNGLSAGNFKIMAKTAGL